MTATSPIDRVVLNHLQIPLKEPFRISGGEVAIKDAILVTVETASAIGHGESSPMAASFGYSADTPEGCWDDLRSSIAPGLIGQTVDSPAAIAALASTWKGSRFAAAGAENALWDLLGQAHHATVAQLLGGDRRADQPGSRVGPGGRPLSLDRRAPQDHRNPPGRGVSPAQDQDPARQRRRARPRRPPALRRDSPDGRRQRSVHGRRTLTSSGLSTSSTCSCSNSR